MSNPECQITNGPSHDEEVTGESAGASASVSSGVLETLIASSPKRRQNGNLQGNRGDQPGLVHGAIIGTVTGWSDSGQPLVLSEEISEFACPARTVIDAKSLQVGGQVVLLFEQGDPDRPIVMATLSDTPASLASSGGTANVQLPLAADNAVEAKVDKDRVVLQANREIVLKCGKASITLTRAGKVILRGAYVLSRSSGVNRIKGGSVKIN